MDFKEKINKSMASFLSAERDLNENISHMINRLNKVFREDITRFPYIQEFEFVTSGVEKILVDFTYVTRGDRNGDALVRILNFVISDGEIIILHDFRTSSNTTDPEYKTGRKTLMRKLFEGLTLSDFDLSDDAFNLRVRYLMGEL